MSLSDNWIAENAERINWITNTCGPNEAAAILGTLFLLDFDDEQWEAFKTGDTNYIIWLTEVAGRFAANGVDVS